MEMEPNMLKAYQTAYDIARNKLRESNPQEIAANTDSIFDVNNNTLRLQYLGDDYLINSKSGEVTLAADEAPVKTTVQVLILHYLLHAAKRQPMGTLISFREVKGGGANYYPSFNKRAILPLQKTFGDNPSLLIRAGAKLGGTAGTFGDASVTLSIFPFVPVTYVVWQGDEEISSSATILFDSHVNSYLPCEDIVLAASFGTYALVGVARSLD